MPLLIICNNRYLFLRQQKNERYRRIRVVKKKKKIRILLIYIHNIINTNILLWAIANNPMA